MANQPRRHGPTSTTVLRGRMCAFGIVCVALLAACTDRDEDTSVRDDDTSVRDDVPTDLSAAPATSTTDKRPAAPAPTATSTAADAHCLVGDWVIPDTQLSEYFETVASTRFDSIASAGEVHISFTADAFTWSDDYRLDVTVGGIAYEVDRSGQLSGSYTISGQRITRAAEVENRHAEFTEDGRHVGHDLGDLFADVFPPIRGRHASYSCDGPTLTIPTSSAIGIEHRFELEVAATTE